MVYGYMIKYHGQYYPAGAEVPVGDIAVEIIAETEDVEAEKTVKPVEKAETPKRGRKRGK